MRYRLLLLALALSFRHHPSHAAVEDNIDPKQAIENQFKNWISAVNEHSVPKLIDLYAEDAILHPTLSPNIHLTEQDRIEYFNRLTSLPDITASLVEHRIKVFGNTGICSGYYDFTFKDNGKTVVLPARFSFTYVKKPQGWLIVEHHSSKRDILN
jgi:hypothetical protein